MSLGHSPFRVNDNMHEHMGSPKFRATQSFWAAREIWAKPVFKDSKTYHESRALMTAICELGVYLRTVCAESNPEQQ